MFLTKNLGILQVANFIFLGNHYSPGIILEGTFCLFALLFIEFFQQPALTIWHKNLARKFSNKLINIQGRRNDFFLGKP